MATWTLKPINPAGVVLTLELAGDATQAGGVGGWEEVARPRREAALEYSGTPARTLTVPSLLDGFAGGTSVEQRVNRLESFGRRTATTSEPPILRAAGPIPHGSRKWVIDDLEWGEESRHKNGNRIQQFVVVTLKEYLSSDVIVTSTAKKSGAKKARTALVLASDMPAGLPRVAQRKLGAASKWPSIAAINKNRKGRVIRDPRDVYVGQELRLP